MNSGRGYQYGGLETVRTRFGEQRAIETFAQAAQRNKAQAAAMANDQTLRFRTFFVLIPHIKTYKINSELNERGRIVLRFCAEMLADEELKECTQNVTLTGNENLHNVLKWMIRTGTQDDGADQDYAKVLDNAAALLADRYHDTSVLPLLVDMLFRRARNGYNIHDLSWALFHRGDPHMLRLVASYLRTERAQDYELACSILHLNPLSNEERAQGRQRQYERYLAWLNDNYDYLFPTEESFQLKSDPEPFAVDVAAKYLVRPTMKREWGAASPAMASMQASNLPREFLKLSEAEQELLAAYSHNLHRKNRADWNRFIALSVSEQLNEAKQNMQTGGTR